MLTTERLFQVHIEISLPPLIAGVTSSALQLRSCPIYWASRRSAPLATKLDKSSNYSLGRDKFCPTDGCSAPIPSGCKRGGHDPEGSRYRKTAHLRGRKGKGGGEPRLLPLTQRTVESTMRKMPRWRNGRRGGLKIRFLQRSVGSSPSLGSE